MQPEEEMSESGPLLETEQAWSWSRRHTFSVVGSLLVASAAVVALGGSVSQSRAKTRETNAFMSAQAAPVCSWEGENCAETMCCHRVGMTCWEKQPNVWAGCSKTCQELAQYGGTWTCKGLGPAKTAQTLAPAASSPTGVSFFCFMVVTPQGITPPGVKPGYEQQLVEAMRGAKASIFACEASAVFEGIRATTGEWKSIKNTDIFAKVWRDVQADGRYLQHPWTVKVDADAVFMPNRLKMHMGGMKPPLGKPIYLKNIAFKFHFMGALEVMNKEAANLLLKNLDNCLDHIGNNGGEDIFTMECLDAIDVPFMEDDSLLDDKYSSPENFNLFDVDRCHNDAIVAFHPYKAVNSWMGCHKVANGEVKPSQFTSCVHRWEGEACSLTSTLDHPGKVNPGSGIVG
jgi:hypothetical protein